MKDIIERIRELPVGENIYISKDGGSNYPYPTKLITDNLKQMAARLSLAVKVLKKIRDMKFIGGRDVAADIARQALANIKGEGGEDEPKLQ